jgi:hypothetical protein
MPKRRKQPRKKHSMDKRVGRLADQRAKLTQQKRFLAEVKATPGYDDMTPEQKALLEDTIAFKQMVESCDSMMDKFDTAFTNAKEKYNCLQVQRILQDIVSIRSHIEDLQTHGPRQAEKEIPLEDSEYSDTEGGNSPFVGMQVPKEMIEDAMMVEAQERAQD